MLGVRIRNGSRADVCRSDDRNPRTIRRCDICLARSTLSFITQRVRRTTPSHPQNAIEGAENGREGREPAPWYPEQAAIIHRKLGQNDQEIAVLERWLRFVPAESRSSTGIGERLAKINR